MKILILLFTTLAFAQKDSTAISKTLRQEFGIMTGVHLSNRPSAEIGFGHLFIDDMPKVGPVTIGYAVSVENYFVPKYSIAPKLSVFTNWILNFGGNILWHTDFNGATALRLRPELGFGYENLRINLGYNLPIYTHHFTGLPDAMLSLNYSVPLVKKYP